MAVASMVLGILAVYQRFTSINSFFAILLAGISMILAIGALSKKEKQNGDKGMIISAFILSGIILAIGIFTFIPIIISFIFSIWTNTFRNLMFFY